MKWWLILINRAEIEKSRFFTNRESLHEFWNWVSHALGVAFVIPAGIWLLSLAWKTQPWQGFIAVLTFVLGFLMLYTSSSLYHYMIKHPKRSLLRKLDHISIFVMIAGTYTPFLVIYLDNLTGKVYLVILWILVMVGIVYKLFLMGKYRWVSLFLYLVMGWILIFNFNGFKTALPVLTLKWIITGGLFYTLGVVFYVWKKLPFNHFVWHLFVLGGSLSHFTAVYYSLVLWN